MSARSTLNRSRSVPKWEFQIGFVTAFILVAIYLYIAYTRTIFPFNLKNKQRIHDIIFGTSTSSSTTTTVTPPVGNTYVCLDGSNPNAATGLCMNGQKPVLVAAPPPGAPGTVPNPLQPILTPSGGTGAVGLSGASGIVNPYQLYCSDGTNPDPTTQLCDDGSSPGAKPDLNVTRTFEQEMYKQLFLPYNKYPYLYGQNYLQGLMPQYGNRCTDGSTPNATTGLCADGSNPQPNPGDVQNLAQNPYANVFGTIPPIQGGDVPPATQNQLAQQYYQQQQNEATYGLFPPGGYTPNPQTTAPLPGTPSSVMASGCFTVGQTTYCLMQGADPSNPPTGCITDGTNVYCPSGAGGSIAGSGAPTTVTNPANAAPGQCFSFGGQYYCQSQADPNTPGCTSINGITYCIVQGGPPPSSGGGGGGGAPSPSCIQTQMCMTNAHWDSTQCQCVSNQNQTSSQGCFNDNTGTQFCPCQSDIPGSITVGGQLFCPGAGSCFTGSDGVTQYCPCTTATAGAVVVGSQLYCIKASAHQAHAQLKAMRSHIRDSRKGAYAMVSHIAKERRAEAKAMTTISRLQPFIPSAVLSRQLPRGGSFSIHRS